MIPPEYNTHAGRRGRKVRTVSGELMVTPIKPITLGTGRTREVLRPGRDRFAPSHEVVRQRPDLFKPADPQDKLTASEMRVMVARARSRPDTGTRRVAPARKPWDLGDRGSGRCPTWRL